MRMASKEFFFKRQKAALRGLFGIFLIAFLFFGSAESARADFWGAAFGAAVMKQTMETIQRQIEGALLSTLKMTATQVLNSQIGQLIGGNTTGEALIITNYEQFLFLTPQQRADTYVTDFFIPRIFGSKGSSVNYISANSSGGISGNYVHYLESVAKNVVAPDKKAQPGYSFDEYGGDPKNMLAEGVWSGFNNYFSNEYNSDIGVALATQGQYISVLEAEQKKQEVIAQSSGFKPVMDKDGNVITPAGTLQDITSNIKTLPNDILANASNPGELVGSVVAGFVSKTVTGLVQQGIGSVQRNIQREVGNVTSQIDSQIRNVSGQLGPAAPLLDDVLRQRTNVNINSSTPPPYGIQGSDGIY